MKRLTLILSSVLLLLVAGIGFIEQPATAAPAAPEADPLTRTYYPSGDSTVSEAQPDGNYGAARTLSAGYDSLTGKAEMILLAFDLSDLPVHAVVESATLELHSTTRTVDAVAIGAVALDGRWRESSVTWNSRPGATDHGDPPTITGAGTNQWDVTQIVTGWVDGDFANYGMLLRLEPRQAGRVSFYSREGSTIPSLTLTYRNTFTTTATKDSYIDSAVPSTNYGSATELWVARDVANDERHTLLHFDTSALPDNIVVTGATLRLYSEINRREPALGPLPIEPEAIVSSWDEYAVTWNNQPASTYLGDPALSWAVGYLYFDVTNIVQAWAGGTVANEGIKLVPQAGATESGFFLDRSHAFVAPQLTVNYEPAPPPCNQIDAVTINGPAQGQTGTLYTFDGTISPVDATGPFTYTWTSAGQPLQSTATADFTWDSAGTKTVSLTVENCAGSAGDTHTVTISEPAPVCEQPLTGLTLTGPTQGIAGDALTFDAVASPIAATTPITFTWEATGQSPVTSTVAAAGDSHAYTWDTSGSKEVVVTAENCGGTFVRNHTLNVLTPSEAPDLTVGSAWYDQVDETIGYILHNLGGTLAPAGHVTELSAGSTLLATQTFTQEIPAGGLRAAVFNQSWACEGTSGLLGLQTDAADVIAEGVEDNNAFSASWSCDLMPPTFTDGPTVSDIGETGATVTWNTSEYTGGHLEYGPGSYATSIAYVAIAGSSHSLNLSGLQPATTYRLRAFARDMVGNEANSQWIYFETKPPGSDPPQITSLSYRELPGSPYEMFTLKASVGDATYVDRVEFYLDGALVGTQYGSLWDTFYQPFAPHALGYSREAFYDWEGRSLEVVAYSTGGASSRLSKSQRFAERTTPVRAGIWAPGAGHTVVFDGTTVPAGTDQDVRVWAARYDWQCTFAGNDYANLPGLRCADANPEPAAFLQLYLDGDRRFSLVPSGSTHTFSLALAGESEGTYDLEVRAYANNDDYLEVSQDLNLVQGKPHLRMTRTVSRQDNLFTIALTLHNEGDGTAKVYEVRDLLQGLVAINKDTRPGRDSEASGYYVVSSKFDNWINSEEPTVVVDLKSGDDYISLPPGDSFTVSYEAIPVIYSRPNIQDHHIGVDENGNRSEIRYAYAGAGQILEVPFSAPGNYVDDVALGDQVPLDEAIPAAYATADYVLATSPYRLSIKTFNSYLIPDLLSDMARLARAADGVIGVTGIAPPFHVVDDLVEPGGHWYESLHPNFRQVLGGYILFVGEDEVVPTRTGGWGVDYSDLRYASVGGAARPELVLGRIIGNDVAGLRRPIQAAAAFHEHGAGFDNSHALLWSGRGEGEGTFWNDVKAMSNRLDDTTAITRFRGKDYASSAELLPVIQDNSTGQDWIIYRGHGGRTGFGHNNDHAVFSTDVPSLDLRSRPVVMALACSTGDYAGGTDGIAETFLQQGAAIFIGSVETSSRSRNSDAARAFFNRWHSGRSVGDTLFDLMRDKWGNSSWYWPDSTTWERWIYDYQLFGDPKYGRNLTPVGRDPDLVQRSERLPQGTGAVHTLELSLPALEISTGEDGWHYVSLPDGDRLALEGEFAVPIHTFTVHYPEGERVQDVNLALRAGLEVTTGLDIPLSFFQLDEQGRLTPAPAGPQSRNDAVAEDPWHPHLEQPFQWRVFENADGSSDLQITLYPFQYHPGTTDGRFYRQWRFEVQTIQTGVTVERLRADPLVHPGQTTSINLDMHNEGGAQDVVLNASIHTSKGEPVAGLPLRTLHALQGSAGATLLWDTTGLAAGTYQVIVTVSDIQGQILDTVSAEMTLAPSRALYLPLVRQR